MKRRVKNISIGLSVLALLFTGAANAELDQEDSSKFECVEKYEKLSKRVSTEVKYNLTVAPIMALHPLSWAHGSSASSESSHKSGEYSAIEETLDLFKESITQRGPHFDKLVEYLNAQDKKQLVASIVQDLFFDGLACNPDHTVAVLKIRQSMNGNIYKDPIGRYMPIDKVFTLVGVEYNQRLRFME